MKQLIALLLMTIMLVNGIGQPLPKSNATPDVQQMKTKARHTRNAAIILGSAGIALIAAAAISASNHIYDEPTGFEAAAGIGGVLAVASAIPFTFISIHYGRMAKKANLAVGIQSYKLPATPATSSTSVGAAVGLTIPLGR